MNLNFRPRKSKHASLVTLSALLSLVSSFIVPQYVIDHAPIIWLHSDDPFMPSDLLRHIHHTIPKLGFDVIPDVPVLNLDTLSSLNKHGRGVFLTAPNDVTSRPGWLLGETPDAQGALHNSTACAVVLVHRNEQEVDAFYFYFYSYDEGGDINQVLPPLEKILPDAKPGDHFGNHVGDWEHNMIRFKNGTPTGIYFSQHSFGEACFWEDEACFSKDGDRPVVFSARGSHANYPFEGSHVHDDALIDLADKGQIWDPVRPAYFYNYDPEEDTFTPSDIDTTPTDWLYYDGAWGDKQYPDSDPRQDTVPYFGLKKFVDGPNGPQFKHLVRKGLVPDERPKDPLMKKLVRWYLSWYGCCLKGYNPWVVVIFIMLVLVFAIVLTVFAVKKLKPRARRWIFGSQGWFAKSRKQKVEPEQEDVQLGLLDPHGADEEDRYRDPE